MLISGQSAAVWQETAVAVDNILSRLWLYDFIFLIKSQGIDWSQSWPTNRFIPKEQLYMYLAKVQIYPELANEQSGTEQTKEDIDTAKE